MATCNGPDGVQAGAAPGLVVPTHAPRAVVMCCGSTASRGLGANYRVSAGGELRRGPTLADAEVLAPGFVGVRSGSQINV